jgi:hypothetical protein
MKLAAKVSSVEQAAIDITSQDLSRYDSLSR